MSNSTSGGAFDVQQVYTGREVRGVVVLLAASALSMTAVTGLLIAIALSAFHTRKSTDNNLFVRTHVAAFFVSLLFCDILQGVGSIMSAKWIQHMAAFSGRFCTSQGVIKQISDVGAAVFSFAIAMQTFWLLFLRWQVSKRALWLTFVLAWLVVAAIVISCAVGYNNNTVRGPFYGISGYWCWITPAYNAERLTLDYLFMFLSALFSFILYTLVFLRLRGTIVISGSYIGLRLSNKSRESTWRRSAFVDTQMMAVAKQMLLYPVAYTVIILPIAAARFSAFGGRDVPFAVTIFCDAVYQLSGLINVVLFTTTRRILPARSIIPWLSRLSPRPPSSKFGDERYEDYRHNTSTDNSLPPPTRQTESYVLDISARLAMPEPDFSPAASPPPVRSMPSGRDKVHTHRPYPEPHLDPSHLSPPAELEDYTRASNEYRRSDLPEFFVPFENSDEEGR